MGVSEDSKDAVRGVDDAVEQSMTNSKSQDAERREDPAEAGAADNSEAAEGDSDGESSEEEELAGEDPDDSCEEIELEFDEDDIVSYLVDEDDNEIGFTLLDEDGNEVEYYYVEDDAEEGAGKGDGEEKNPYDLGITKEGVARATNDMNAIYKDGIAVATELKGALDDIKSAFDFTSVLKKK